MGADVRMVLLRLGAALLSVGAGWLLCLALYLVLANPSSHDKAVWELWTARFCLAGWLLVGLPLAIFDPDLSSRIRAAAGVLAVGVVGMLMTAVFFRSLVNLFSGLAFITAASSMAVYVGLCRAFPTGHAPGGA